VELQKDFEDFCVSLNGRSVEYVIVGGYALAFHGAPRFTGDLGREAFIANEQAVGRAKDLADIEALGASGQG